MRRILTFFSVTILLACSSSTESRQNKINLPQTLIGTWVYEDYYNSIIETHSPFQSKNFLIPILGFYYYPSDKYFRPKSYTDKTLEIYSVGGAVNYFHELEFDTIKNEITFEYDINQNEKPIKFSLTFNPTEKDTTMTLKYKIANEQIIKTYVKPQFTVIPPDQSYGFIEFMNSMTVAGLYLKEPNDTIFLTQKGEDEGPKKKYYSIEYDFTNPTKLNDRIFLDTAYYWKRQNNNLILIDTTTRNEILLKMINAH
ncbi:hypothetical protein BH10BAC1_BH10BAC1_09810 [soil metagenome]